jgi:hypothetical protein
MINVGVVEEGESDDSTDRLGLKLNFGSVDGGFWVFEVEALHEIDDDRRDGDVAIPLVIGWDDEPRGVLAAGGGEDVVVGVDVVRPELTFLDVGVGELPLFVLVVDAGLEAAGLLFVRDVEIELEDEDVVVGEEAFELVDVVEATLRDFAGDELVNARGQNIFVVGSVEDADHTARGHLCVNAPEEVVAGFERGGDLEGGDVAALRVDAGEDVADGAVLAGCIHALQDDEERFGLAGVEDVLQVGKLGALRGQNRFGSFIGLEVGGIGGRYPGEPYLGMRLDEIRRLYFHESRLVESRLRQW